MPVPTPIPASTIKDTIEFIAALTMPLAVAGLIFNRLFQKSVTEKNGEKKTKCGSGIGARAIQFVSMGMFFPTIIILGLENKIGAETLAALLGGAVGYLLSGLGNYDLTRMVEKLIKAAVPSSPAPSEEED